MPENTKNTQKTLFARRRRRKKSGKSSILVKLLNIPPLVNHRSATRGGINNKNCTDTAESQIRGPAHSFVGKS